MTADATGEAGLPRFEYAATPPVGVPVIEVQLQCDVEGFSFEQFVNPAARRSGEDSDAAADRFRLYEIGGAPHSAKIAGCDGDGSGFPMSAFVRGTLLQLFRGQKTISHHRERRASPWRSTRR